MSTTRGASDNARELSTCRRLVRPRRASYGGLSATDHLARQRFLARMPRQLVVYGADLGPVSRGCGTTGTSGRRRTTRGVLARDWATGPCSRPATFRRSAATALWAPTGTCPAADYFDSGAIDTHLAHDGNRVPDLGDRLRKRVHDFIGPGPSSTPAPSPSRTSSSHREQPGRLRVDQHGLPHGQETASFDATDNTGIQRTRVAVDGVPLQSAATTWACDFTYTVPCQNRSPGYAVNTAEIADGGHTLTLSAVDPGANERTISRAITVDNHAPAPPSGLAVVGGEGWHDTTSFAVTWSNPAGQVAPIVAADYELCGAVGCTQSARCRARHPSDRRSPRSTGRRVHASVWLEDAAGNLSASNRSGLVHLRSGKEPTTILPPAIRAEPGEPTAPRSVPRVKLSTVRVSGTHLVVRGTLAQGRNRHCPRDLPRPSARSHDRAPRSRAGDEGPLPRLGAPLAHGPARLKRDGADPLHRRRSVPRTECAAHHQASLAVVAGD